MRGDDYIGGNPVGLGGWILQELTDRRLQERGEPSDT